jgi:hypothetical protein
MEIVLEGTMDCNRKWMNVSFPTYTALEGVHFQGQVVKRLLSQIAENE